MSTSEALRNVLRIPNLYLVITFIDITALWLFFNVISKLSHRTGKVLTHLQASKEPFGREGSQRISPESCRSSKSSMVSTKYLTEGRWRRFGEGSADSCSVDGGQASDHCTGPGIPIFPTGVSFSSLLHSFAPATVSSSSRAAAWSDSEEWTALELRISAMS